MYKPLFWICAAIGRPFGGLKPRRIVHWLARRAYGSTAPEPSDFRWFRDAWGHELFLHPHYFVDYQVLAFGEFDVPLGRFIRAHVRPGMWCLDVGANTGMITLQLARRAGSEGRIDSFEPVPHLRERLRAHVERNGYKNVVRIHEEALSNASGTAAISIASGDRPNQGMGTLVETSHPDLRERLEIRTVTLDEFSASQPGGTIDLIKMDVQGAEPLVLEGARATLERDRPDLLMEVSPLDLAPLGRTSRDLIAQIEGLGYRCRRITDHGAIGAPVEAKSTPVDLWLDNVFCRHHSRELP
jgi:FkbM family methyltransferase